jgi:membrane protease YdiL (CAAX protease family)
MLVGLGVWTVVGLVMAGGFGAFRKGSIVGPERLRPEDSGWDLMIIFCMAFSLTSMGAAYVLKCDLTADVKMLVLSAVGSLGACAAILLLLTLFRPGLLRSLGANPRWIPSGLAGGAATLFVLYPLIMLCGVAVTYAYQALNAPPPGPHELLQLLGNTHDRRLMAVTIALAVVGAPIAEEMMYRGLLQTALIRGFWGISTITPATDSLEPVMVAVAPASARWAGVVVASIVFAAVHMNLAFFFPIFILALGLGYIYERTGNIWVNIAAHSLFNSAQILLFVASGR